MARRPPPQPSLNLGLPGLRLPRPESHVEYDRTPKRPSREEPVFQRPTPPPPARPRPESETPWWDRVQQIAETPKPPAEPVSFAQTWRGLLAEAGWFDELPPAHRAMLEACARGLEVRPGVVEAGYGKTGERPHRVQLRVAPFTQAEWARALRYVVDGGRAEAMLAELDQGHVPLSLLDACDACELVLAPKRIALVVAACTCGFAGLPCDHVLATHLALARHLGRVPLALLALRGAATDEIRSLLSRVQEEAMRARADSTGPADVDPFAATTSEPIDWASLAQAAPVRPPLPPVEGWRASETLDAMARRLLEPVREACARHSS